MPGGFLKKVFLEKSTLLIGGMIALPREEGGQQGNTDRRQQAPSDAGSGLDDLSGPFQTADFKRGT